MGNGKPFRSPDGNAKSLREVIERTAELWRRAGLDYDRIRYVTREARRRLRVRRPNGFTPPPEVLAAGELEALLKTAEADSDRGLIFLALFETGARVSEIVALRADDFASGALRLRNRALPLSPALSGALARSLQERPRTHLFESGRGGPFTPRRVQQIVKELAARAGVLRRVHPGLLRRTAARLRLENGADLEHLKRFLGHARMQTTRNLAGNGNGA